MKIEGQVAVITGGCSGLGLGTAEYLISLGAKVVLIDINEDSGRGLVAKLGPANAHFICADISKEEQVKSAFERAVAVYETPARIFVNCAGIGLP